MPNHHWDAYDIEMPLPSGGELYQTPCLVCFPQTLLSTQTADKCGSPSRNLTFWSSLPGFLRTCSFHTRPSLLAISQVSHFSCQSCCLPSCCSLPPRKGQAIDLFSSHVPFQGTSFLSQPWLIRRVWDLTDARASEWWLSSFVFLIDFLTLFLLFCVCFFFPTLENRFLVKLFLPLSSCSPWYGQHWSARAFAYWRFHKSLWHK